jgi:hypothetical protein
MDARAEEDGYLQPLGPRHHAFFAETGPELLVTFARAEGIRARPDLLPERQALADAHGWSHLCLIAEGETWWRDPAVYAFFDRLVDDAFFDDFDRVLFLGAGAAGYAAAAYSVAAPGARVLALAPRATVDPARAGWDGRDRAARRLCFTDRYGFAPAMTEGCDRMWIVHDPLLPADAMHASLFAAPQVQPLRARHAGAEVAQMVDDMDLTPALARAAMAGTLTAQDWAGLWRARRAHVPWLRAVLQRTVDAGRRGLEIRALRHITATKHAPRLARRLATLLAEPAEPGGG